jgi:hypothetical protein
MKETVHVRESLFDKASEIASEFKIKEIRPCVVVVKETTNYCIDNPSDYWRISLHIAFLEEISKLIVSNEESFFCILSKH